MKSILFLPTQGPHLPRPGRADQADWRTQCRIAAQLQREISDAIIFVPSAFQQEGARSELELYARQLLADGVSENALLLTRLGFETVEQCELAMALAERERARLIVICCRVQLPRVRYLFKGNAVELVIAEGIPNRRLRYTNLVLTFVFPALDGLGLRAWWKRLVVRQRRRGIQ